MLLIHLFSHPTLYPHLDAMDKSLYDGHWLRIGPYRVAVMALEGPSARLPLGKQKRPFSSHSFILGNFVLTFSESVLDFQNVFKDHFWNKYTVVLSETWKPLIRICWLSQNISCHFSWVFREAFVVSGIFFVCAFNSPNQNQALGESVDWACWFPLQFTLFFLYWAWLVRVLAF